MGAGDGATDLSLLKDKGCVCAALFCAEFDCIMCEAPLIAGQAKLCCCNLQLWTECPCITGGGAGCYDAEHGCCEANVKLCCLYVEAQLPPSTKDIGFGLCGM